VRLAAQAVYGVEETTGPTSGGHRPAIPRREVTHIVAQTVAQIEARLAKIRTAIDAILDGQVEEFEHEGGDRAKMLKLADLRRLEESYEKQLLAAQRRSGRFRKIYKLGLLIVIALACHTSEAAMQTTIVTGCGVTTHEVSPAPQSTGISTTPRRSPAKAYHAPYVGATLNRLNADFQPAHRSADSGLRESWDLVTRRMRWMAENAPLMRRLVNLLAQHVVGEGISCYSAAIDHVPITEASDILRHPLFAFGDESDDWHKRWAENWADVERGKTLYEMQHTSALDLFSSGNSLWLECRKRNPDGIAPVCYQLLEPEQLDRSKDRPASKAINRISNGIEYNADNEAVAYWLYDAHPYDDGMAGFAISTRSSRVPASRVIHTYLSTRGSQHFGVSIGQAALQSARDADWLVGHELTSAALAAGLTLLIKEDDAAGDLDFDATADTSLYPWAQSEEYGTPTLEDVGLASGMVARCSTKENVEVIESGRPNRDVAPFVKFIQNLIAMSGGVSFHRFTGDPTGASFATLRAMINDDRAMALRIIHGLGRKIAVRPRVAFDRLQVALGKYRSVGMSEYLRSPHVYEDFDVLGPPLRNLNPKEDVDSARARIACGLSTLRIECGLLNLSYRKVLRQLAVERDIAAALRLTLDFSSGGGQAPGRTTTDAGGSAGNDGGNADGQA
jgi:capsid protein